MESIGWLEPSQLKNLKEGRHAIVNPQERFPGDNSDTEIFVKENSNPNEDEIRVIAMTEIARRLELAKLALLQVDLDYDLRKGFISVDTMRDVTRALSLLR